MGLIVLSSRRNYRREQSGRKSPGDFALRLFVKGGVAHALSSHEFEWGRKKTLHLEKILVNISGWPESGLFLPRQVCGSLGVQEGQSWSTASLPQWYLFLFRGAVEVDGCAVHSFEPWPKLCGRTGTCFDFIISNCPFLQHSFPVLYATDWLSVSGWLFLTSTFC